MIEGLISLASYGLGTGGDIGNALFSLEQMGVFSYLLPFLLIFALVYGILSKTNILGNSKGINVVLALAIGLMALQFNFVSYFFSEIFPRLGVGLAILLVIVVLLSAFVDLQAHPQIKWVFGIVGALITLIIVFQSLGSSFGFGSNFGFNTWGITYFLQRNLGIILVIGVFALLFWKIISSGDNTPKPKAP
jgi:hypothetical protein